MECVFFTHDMALKNTKPTNQSGASGKKRFNISMADATRERGNRLAKSARRSFSNLLEVLIDAEHARHSPSAPAHNKRPKRHCVEDWGIAFWKSLSWRAGIRLGV